MKNIYIPIITGILLSLLIIDANAETSFFVIVDASVAMQEKKDNVLKINILKKGLIHFIESLDEPVQMGMIICGNTKNKGCDTPFDDMSLRMMDEKNKSVYLRTIRNLRPQGEIPLSKALIRAIKTLNTVNGKRVVIILGSGEDSCSFYPCEEAVKVIRNSKDISVNSIGIDIGDESAQSYMNCLARVGKGICLNALSVDDIENGLNQIVKGALSNLEIYITLSKGKPFFGNIRASLYHLNEPFLYQDYKGYPVFFSVTPGPYRLILECSDKHINITREMNDIVVPETGEKTVSMDLDLGVVDIDTTLSEDRTPPQHIVTHIFRAGDHENSIGQTDLIPFSYYLPPGIYDFLMEVNHFGYQKSIWLNAIQVKAGKKSYRTLNLMLAKLKLAVYESQNEIYKGPLKMTVYSSGDHDTAILATDSRPEALYLPQGRYDILVEIENEIYSGSHWRNSVPVTYGETTLEFINLALGKVSCLTHATPDETVPSAIKSQIFHTGSADIPIFETDQNPFDTLLPAGRYDIRIEYTGTFEKIQKWEKNILVIPGQTIEKTINLGLRAFEVHFYTADAIDVSDFVKTTLFRTGLDSSELLVNQKGPLNMLLPMGAYDLKFELLVSERRKIYWKRNVQITSEPVQSFNVTFPNEDFNSY
ncbi:MAG: hypothetical protein KJ737_24130 [Proteobacteria bacterium]|nr:hypothetical protein [Pseudomonadota bacterium]